MGYSYHEVIELYNKLGNNLLSWERTKEFELISKIYARKPYKKLLESGTISIHVIGAGFNYGVLRVSNMEGLFELVQD